MQVNQELCVGCGQCVPYCPMVAITVVSRKASIDLAACVECSACVRSGACKFDALYQQTLEGPRVVRSLLSDVFTEYQGIAGRGTEEMKTNDVTGRFKRGYSGIAVELGRPGVGATFRDLEVISATVAKHGVAFETKNPCTNYITDKTTGKVQEDILDEKVMSGIVEILVKNEQLEVVLKSILNAAKDVNTVFSVAVACAVEADNTIPAQKILDQMGIKYRPNCKTNLGLGRPKAEI